VKPRERWESPSLEWVHEIRESRYRETRTLPLEAWLKPVDPQKAVRACRRMGLRVRLSGVWARIRWKLRRSSPSRAARARAVRTASGAKSKPRAS
jgi:hypothetical protein